MKRFPWQTYAVVALVMTYVAVVCLLHYVRYKGWL